MYTLIQSASGERLLVKSLDGHEGCTVVRKNVPEPPSAFHRLNDTGKWEEDAGAKERNRLNRMTRAELIDEVIRRVQTANLASGGGR